MGKRAADDAEAFAGIRCRHFLPVRTDMDGPFCPRGRAKHHLKACRLRCHGQTMHGCQHDLQQQDHGDQVRNRGPTAHHDVASLRAKPGGGKRLAAREMGQGLPDQPEEVRLGALPASGERNRRG